MLYLFSVAAVLMLSFSTIVWRIRAAEKAESETGEPGNNDSTPGKSNGSYSYKANVEETSNRSQVFFQIFPWSKRAFALRMLPIDNASRISPRKTI